MARSGGAVLAQHRSVEQKGNSWQGSDEVLATTPTGPYAGTHTAQYPLALAELPRLQTLPTYQALRAMAAHQPKSGSWMIAR